MNASLTLRELSTSRKAFTLVELLTTLTVITLLASLLFSTLSASTARSRRVACINGIKQLTTATLLYASDDSRQSLSAKEAAEDQDLSWLFSYATSRQTFVCPSTRNTVRANKGVSTITMQTGLQDLIDLAHSKASNGKSYQGMGFTGVGVDVTETIPVFGGQRTLNGIRKTLVNINTYQHYHDSFGLKGVVPGASQIWIIVDNQSLGEPYYPDKLDNHGSDGANVGFCDGHVTWVTRQSYLRSYELSQDEGRTAEPLTW